MVSAVATGAAWLSSYSSTQPHFWRMASRQWAYFSSENGRIVVGTISGPLNEWMDEGTINWVEGACSARFVEMMLGEFGANVRQKDAEGNLFASYLYGTVVLTHSPSYSGLSIWGVSSPHWLPLVLFTGFGVFGAYRWTRSWRIRARMQAGMCPQCAYNLAGNRSGRCPECGWRLDATLLALVDADLGPGTR